MSKAIVLSAVEIGAGVALDFTGVGAAAGAWLNSIGIAKTAAAGAELAKTIGTSLLLSGAMSEAGAIAQAIGSHDNPGVTTRTAASARRIIYGTQRVGGTIVYENTTGSDHHHFNMVVVLATHPCERIEHLYLDGRRVVFSNNNQQHEVGDYGQYYINYGDGSDGFGGYADPGTFIGPDGQDYTFGTEVFAHAHFGNETVGNVDNSDICGGTGEDTQWGATTSALTGCTWVYLRFTYDTSHFPQFPPDIKFTVRGKNDIYDPRTGRSGYTTNWALCVADMISNEQWGVGAPVNQDQLIAAANICDEQVECAAGNESRYALNMNYDTATAPADVVKQALSPAAGRVSLIGEDGAKEWYIWPAYWQAPSFTFDKSVLIDEVKWSPKRSLADLCNRITGTYTAANYPYNTAGNLYDSNGWYNGTIQNNFPYAFQPTNFPMYACDQVHGYGTGIDVYLQEDGGIVLPKEINLQNCLSISQSQRIAKIELMRNRQQGSGILSMGLAGLLLQPTDVIQFNFPEIGWTSKVLEVIHVTQKMGSPGSTSSDGNAPGIWFEVEVQETDPSVYDWDPTEELTPYDVAAITVGDSWIVPTPTNLTIQDSDATATVNGEGVSVPNMLATWTPPLDVRVNNGGAIECQYQITYDVPGGPTAPIGVSLTENPDGTYTTDWIDVGKFSGQATYCLIPGIPETSTVTVQIRALRANGAASDWVQAGFTHSVAGVPEQVINISAVESPYKTDSGQLMSLVAVDFTVGQLNGVNDPNFDHAEVYFSGYNGASGYQLMSQGSTSPIEFLCSTTGESVTVTVVAVGPTGTPSGIDYAPTTTVSLDGVVSAPPAPSISAAQTALNGANGWQFSFNVLGGLEQDLISCYRIYHSEENSTPVPGTSSSAYYTVITQPTTNSGPVTVQEVTGDILYYWVSSVNVNGMESSLTHVPFSYVDPNNPSPPTPAPVVTTNNYTPTVILNGWGYGAHVGYWETQNSDNGTTFGYSHSQVANPFSNPTYAYDGSQATAASWSMEHNAEYAGCVWGFPNFTALASNVTVQQAVVSVTADVVQTAGPLHGQGSVWVSTDNGVTWSQVFLTDYKAGGGPLPKQTWTANIPLTQDFTKLQVMACAHSHDDLAMDVYEIVLSITQSAPAGPGQVTGVSASLVNNDVQISWNALLPATRTDIIAYEVTRAAHGAGYNASYTHGTINPNGSSSYSWTDTTAHDGSYDYWVIAQNSTGWSAPSEVATLYNAAYLGGTAAAAITPIAGLMPAEAGAQQTAGKPIDVLTDGVYARPLASGLTNGVVNLASGVHVGALPYSNAPVAVATAVDSSGNVQNLGGIPAASITPIASLMPIESGAERTTGKLIDVLADGNYARVKASGLSNGVVNLSSGIHVGQLPYSNLASAVQLGVSSSGNVLLKNTSMVSGTTALPTISSTFADLPELGSGNPAMTFTTYGNPLLVAVNLTYYARSGSGSSGGVESIGWTLSSFTTSAVSPQVPTINISISGNGSGAGASVSWSAQQSGSTITFTPTLTLYGGSGYTAATATVIISNAPSGSGYTNGTNTYTCSILTATAYAGANIQSQVLMDGAPVMGPVQVTTDNNGNAVYNGLVMLFAAAGSHSLHVQAQNLSSSAATVSSSNRIFSLIELG
jgi:hypothetical protein